MTKYIRAVDAINKIMDAMMINPSHYGEIYNTGMREAASKIDSIPPEDVVPVVRCRECRYNDKNCEQMFEGVPVIMAHNVCRFWGHGCVTSPDGFCYKGKPKEETV